MTGNHPAVKARAAQMKTRKILRAVRVPAAAKFCGGGFYCRRIFQKYGRKNH
jgi:hypothetical protein